MMPTVLLFLSGVAALVYQTLWVKQLALIVGVDVYAVTTAVRAFFPGLAIGGGCEAGDFSGSDRLLESTNARRARQ